MSRFMCLIYYLRGMVLNCGDKFLVRSGQGAVLVVVQDNLLRSGITICFNYLQNQSQGIPRGFRPFVWSLY